MTGAARAPPLLLLGTDSCRFCDPSSCRGSNRDVQNNQTGGQLGVGSLDLAYSPIPLEVGSCAAVAARRSWRAIAATQCSSMQNPAPGGGCWGRNQYGCVESYGMA